MSDRSRIAPLDLAALMASRVCHDIISPVGAITNGLELLEDDTSEEMRGFAMELIRKSARLASVKLQFARLAFGASGSAGAEIDLGDAETAARAFMAGEKADLEWRATRVLMPKNKVKLLLSLLLVATHAVPRGGRIDISVEGAAAAPVFTLTCSGPGARVPPGEEYLNGGFDGELPDARMVLPLYAGLLAEATAMRVSVTRADADVVFVARPIVAEG